MKKSASILVLTLLLAVPQGARAAFFAQGPQFLWPGGNVYYVLPDNYEFRTEALEAMNLWQQGSAGKIRFVPANPSVHKAYFVFAISEQNLSRTSHIGFPNGVGRLEMSRAYPAAMRRPILIHELGHILGFLHEHQRYDRDLFVRLLTQNIWAPAMQVSFGIPPAGKGMQSSNYDFLSIMQYGSTLCSVNGLPTMVQRGNNATITMARGPSATDYAMLVERYSPPPPPCPAGTAPLYHAFHWANANGDGNRNQWHSYALSPQPAPWDRNSIADAKPFACVPPGVPGNYTITSMYSPFPQYQTQRFYTTYWPEAVLFNQLFGFQVGMQFGTFGQPAAGRASLTSCSERSQSQRLLSLQGCAEYRPYGYVPERWLGYVAVPR